MAQFIFEIPDLQAARIAQAVCTANGYAPASAQDATEFTKQWVFRTLARMVIEQEANAAATQASSAVYGNADDPLAQALLSEQ